MTLTEARSRAVGLATSRASGAMLSQLWQAATSLGLQVLVARQLGAEGLGLFALCVGVIVTATAVTSGVIGDSLTVLDRHDVTVRAGLQWWAVVLIGASSVLSAAVLAATGVLTVTGAMVYLSACAVFQVEEILRRILMAELRFWHLLIVDSAALVVTLGTIGICAVTSSLSLVTVLLGVTVGQVAGGVVAWAMLPPVERTLVSFRRPAVMAVAGFGLWRGMQVAVNPALLTAVRSLIVVAAGAAALGELEAARIFVAPAVLVIQGLGSYLLASYVRDKAVPLRTLMGRATSACCYLAAGTLVLGAAAALVAPAASHLVVGAALDVSPAGVFGWAVYAAATATVAPFASLAAARGRQRAVFGLRVVDGLVSLGLLVVGLFLLRLPAQTAPYAMAAGLVVGGVLIRRLVLRPMLHHTGSAGPAGGAAPSQRASAPPGDASTGARPDPSFRVTRAEGLRLTPRGRHRSAHRGRGQQPDRPPAAPAFRSPSTKLTTLTAAHSGHNAKDTA